MWQASTTIVIIVWFAVAHCVSCLSSTTTTSTVSRANNLVSELVSGDRTWNSFVGEADRAFRLGIQLEKTGQARQAAGSFHEAATLYQCYLDRATEFGHVTQLGDDFDACRQILAYACLSLGYLNLDALKDPRAAARLYKLAASIDPVPTAVSYDGMGQSLEAAGEPLEAAIAAYRQALELQHDNPKVQFHLAVALDRLKTSETDEYGRTANELLELLRRQEAVTSCLVDSWGYVRWHMRKVAQKKKNSGGGGPGVVNLYRGSRDMLELALRAADPLLSTTTTSGQPQQQQQQQRGLVCEFGVGSGRTIRMTQEILPLSIAIHGFDTFTGLPQAWGDAQPAGAYSTGGLVPVLTEEGGKVVFHKGLFRDTIGPFLEQAGDDSVLAYANIDCRLYTSTLDILEAMHGRIVEGTVLVFSEYMCHPTWRQDLFRAWRESCKRFGWKYEYLAFSFSTKQAVVRVTSA